MCRLVSLQFTERHIHGGIQTKFDIHTYTEAHRTETGDKKGVLGHGQDIQSRQQDLGQFPSQDKEGTVM